MKTMSFVVVNKAANTVVHPGYGNYDGTLVNALIYHFDNLPAIPSDLFWPSWFGP